MNSLFEFKNDGGRIESGELVRNLGWKIKEYSGDVEIRALALEAAQNLFGRENYRLIRSVSDHANSNELFYRASRYYEIDAFGQFIPRDSKRQVKAIADMFEAWIGFGIDSRKLFDGNDRLIDLRRFFYEFYARRYHELLVKYAYGGLSRNPDLTRDPRREGNIHEVRVGKDSVLDRNLANSRTVGKVLGFFVTIQEVEPQSSNKQPRTWSAFSPTIKNAREMAASRLWSRARPSPFISL